MLMNERMVANQISQKIVRAIYGTQPSFIPHNDTDISLGNTILGRLKA